ncbi:uncharacterized protein LOC106702550 [Latimeria chalumnae]|uniref:uncharacterized protein LOC106702550 n=1 Tax=Latimeria chalumnae TaxID=7897 RepID=UPI0006D90D56|nr:PREDICTED: uncharacterized protein LOC106702550 isoform X2 [Latimeria chalumnae]XP_014340693.1 PREDICTED: uncharacterized protein LOC106702550 isoform X2 [Latimeria chalumnae]|eukprot:XP_014340692.1 PREDICTED: uncharacterized protein LOC106702550 isoform X2 [Latimeria chalumnae]
MITSRTIMKSNVKRQRNFGAKKQHKSENKRNYIGNNVTIDSPDKNEGLSKIQSNQHESLVPENKEKLFQNMEEPIINTAAYQEEKKGSINDRNPKQLTFNCQKGTEKRKSEQENEAMIIKTIFEELNKLSGSGIDTIVSSIAKYENEERDEIVLQQILKTLEKICGNTTCVIQKEDSEKNIVPLKGRRKVPGKSDMQGKTEEYDKDNSRSVSALDDSEGNVARYLPPELILPPQKEIKQKNVHLQKGQARSSNTSDTLLKGKKANGSWYKSHALKNRLRGVSLNDQETEDNTNNASVESVRAIVADVAGASLMAIFMLFGLLGLTVFCKKLSSKKSPKMVPSVTETGMKNGVSKTNSAPVNKGLEYTNNQESIRKSQPDSLIANRSQNLIVVPCFSVSNFQSPLKVKGSRGKGDIHYAHPPKLQGVPEIFLGSYPADGKEMKFLTYHLYCETQHATPPSESQISSPSYVGSSGYNPSSTSRASISSRISDYISESDHIHSDEITETIKTGTKDIESHTKHGHLLPLSLKSMDSYTTAFPSSMYTKKEWPPPSKTEVSAVSN